jgi:hypothetical protein
MRTAFLLTQLIEGRDSWDRYGAYRSIPSAGLITAIVIDRISETRLYMVDASMLVHFLSLPIDRASPQLDYQIRPTFPSP